MTNEELLARIRNAKITVAPSDRIDALEFIAVKFFREILDEEFEDCLITDESDLRHFDDAGPLFTRIEQVYGIDVRDTGGNIAAILERIWLQSGAA